MKYFNGKAKVLVFNGIARMSTPHRHFFDYNKNRSGYIRFRSLADFCMSRKAKK
jgi:hypothetical protein